MLRFTLTQLLMGTALVAIVLAFTQAEGCGRKTRISRFLKTTLDHLTTKIMYPPPTPDIITQLVGCVVELISFGKYVVHVSFENGDNLSVTCPFRFDTRETVTESPVHECPLSNSNMLRAIGSSINQAECDSDGTLRLRFTNGNSLIAYANDPGYEAYTLSLSGKEYVV